MTFIKLTTVASIWLCLFSAHLVKGRDLTENKGMNVESQNTSTFYGNKWDHPVLQTTGTNANDQYTYHWAVIKTKQDVFYGVKATLNIYGLPTVKKDQTSAMEIRFWSEPRGPNEDFNIIRVGWQVNPGLYGDHETRFFIRWTADRDYKSGCYDLRCDGFVANKTSALVPGYRVLPLSQYDGEQRFITIKLSKDPFTGNWWLHHGPDGNRPIGHFPTTIFTSLATHADQIQIGGMVSSKKGDSSPPMGSGHFANEGEGKAASITDVNLADQNGELIKLRPDDNTFDHYYDDGHCYTVAWPGDLLLKATYIGGPGGCTY